MKKRLVFVFLFVTLVVGCQEGDKIIKTGKYRFIDSLNISCTIPKESLNELNNFQWKKEDESVFHGSLCELVNSYCTSEIYIFKSGNTTLTHRVHYFGSPDDTFYLIYNDKKYHCKREVTFEEVDCEDLGAGECGKNPNCVSNWVPVGGNLPASRFGKCENK